MLKKTLIGISIILIAWGLYRLAELYSPGSYPNVEKYNLNLNENGIVNVINRFKEMNPKYVPPHDYGLKDGRKNKNDHWYGVYFYYPESKEILYVWLRPSSSTTTTVGFVSVNKGNKLGHWKDINRDFDSAENLLQKRKFNELILDPIRKMIHDKN